MVLVYLVAVLLGAADSASPTDRLESVRVCVSSVTAGAAYRRPADSMSAIQ